MSPITFLMVFNPLLKIAEIVECPGFTLRISIPDSADHPECSQLFSFSGMNLVLTNPVDNTDVRSS